MSFDIREVVRDTMDQLSKVEDVQILYAAESGSRAWGFESKDSDYDVRFVYARTLNSYVSIFEPRLVLDYNKNLKSRFIFEEVQSKYNIDLVGWDLKKALRLLDRGNPQLIEWFNSPVIYTGQDDYFYEDFHALIDKFFNMKVCLYHYSHMASGNYVRYISKPIVKLKKYLYVLRPILVCMYVDFFNKKPPVDFNTVLEALKDDLSPEIFSIIEKLISVKKSGNELDYHKPIKELNEFIEYQLRVYTTGNIYGKGSRLIVPKTEVLDEFLMKYIMRWTI